MGMNNQPVFNVKEKETASMQQSAKTGEASRDHHYRPTRPPLHERQSSYAKRHASVDTPREVPLLKDWTNANGDPAGESGEYPFPAVFLEETPHRPELQPSHSSSGADSTTSLPSLDPISTHISQLPPQTHLSNKPDDINSPLLFSDLDPDDILTPPSLSQNPIPTDISTKRVTDPDMLTYTHPSSPYLPPRPPSPPLPTLELSPMPSRSRMNTNIKKTNGDEQTPVETTKKSPNFYEPQPASISGPMPLQARRVPSPPASISAHQPLPQKRPPVTRKPPPMFQPKSILKNAVPPSLPLAGSKGWSSASPGLISILQSPTNPEMKELLRLRNANRGRPVKDEELDMGPPSPPRILDTPDDEGPPWRESGGGMPDVPYTPKHSLDTFRMSSASDPLPREREREQLPLPETAELKRNSTNTTPSRRASRGKGAVYEKFLAKEGAPPSPESGLGREIVVETKEKSYDIVVKLEGVGVEGITLTTRRPRTLLLSADYYHSTKGGHFERRIAFGSDADLGGVRAEFDGVWLRVIVPRKMRGGKRENGMKMAATAAGGMEPPVSA